MAEYLLLLVGEDLHTEDPTSGTPFDFNQFPAYGGAKQHVFEILVVEKRFARLDFRPFLYEHLGCEAVEIEKVEGVNVTGNSFGNRRFCSADEVDVQPLFYSDVSRHMIVDLRL